VGAILDAAFTSDFSLPKSTGQAASSIFNFTPIV
jgi:hypothetical protein